MPRILSQPLKSERKWGLNESNFRSIAKALSWRFIASGATFIISLLVSADLSVAGTIAAVQFVANIILYFVHERIWNKIKWGKSYG
jgi:uncharacterized membrane protein